MTQVSVDSAEPPDAAGPAGRSRTPGLTDEPGHAGPPQPSGPIERLMSTLIRKLARTASPAPQEPSRSRTP